MKQCATIQARVDENKFQISFHGHLSTLGIGRIKNGSTLNWEMHLHSLVQASQILR